MFTDNDRSRHRHLDPRLRARFTPREVPLDEGDVSPAEPELARQLIDQAATDDFDASAFKDEVRERMLELIEQKVAGHEITAAPAHEPWTQIIDLMAALKASIGEGESRKPAARAGKKATAAKSGKKTAMKKASSG